MTMMTKPVAITGTDCSALEGIRTALNQVLRGKAAVVEQVLTCLLARGHLLIEDLPGLGKTTLAKAVAHALGGTFARVQCTPDLLPGDITGFRIFNQNTREFEFMPGPVFADVLLADEINRTTPRTQSALLEAMAERQVTVDNVRHVLSDTFFVIATQNPVEQHGTYPLPEAQLDRFMFNTFVDYPSEEEELAIVKRTTTDTKQELTASLSGEEIMHLQHIVRRVPVADHVSRYALQFTRLTRREKGDVPDFIHDYVSWGAGPRASQYLVLGAKARAVLHGRYYANCDDIRAVAHPVLRHRIMTNFNAEAEGIKPEAIIQKLIETIPVPEDETTARGKLPEVFRPADVG
jgi:MoxR-like ATPase